jgi:hypothetical protein
MFSRRSLFGLLPAAVVAALFSGKAKASDQPRMQAALDALKTARRELEAATNDKGGHRRKALSLVNQAINQVEQGIKFDRRH